MKTMELSLSWKGSRFILVPIVLFSLLSFQSCCKKCEKETQALKNEKARLETLLHGFTEQTTQWAHQIGVLQQKIATLENEKIELTKKLEGKNRSKKK